MKASEIVSLVKSGAWLSGHFVGRTNKSIGGAFVAGAQGIETYDTYPYEPEHYIATGAMLYGHGDPIALSGRLATRVLDTLSR